MEERAKKIIEACMKEKSVNPIEIFNHVAQMDFIRIHRPWRIMCWMGRLY